MLKGNISNRVAQRWLFQFEGTIANPPRVRRMQIAGRRHGRWRREFGQWQTRAHTVKLVNDLYWRQDFRFDVVTFLDLPPAGIEAVQDYLDALGLPFGHVLPLGIDDLAKQLVYMLDVVRVVHSEPGAKMKFGAKGLYVPLEQEDGYSLWE